MTQVPDILQLKTYLTTALRQEMEANPPAAGTLRQGVTEMLEKITQRARLNLDDRLRQGLFGEILDEVIGYGAIQPFLDQPDISEIMVNGPGCVYIERDGELIETSAHFESAEQVLRLIDRMLHPLGRSVDADHPMADARLPDGSRVNAVIPPVAIDGPCITIRKFLRNTMTIQEFIQLGSLTEHMSEFLQACVAARLNLLISGPTSSGKTTLLNILTGFIPGEERIITIEDAVELQLKQKHVLRLETKSRNVDGAGEVTARDLVRNCLRMRPDRIIIGEVRSGEALDMLQSMNTGHQGSLTTLHANSPRDALSRLETMVLMAGLELPLLAIRRQIASAINLVVHMSRLTDGARKVTHLTEVSGMEGEVVTMSDIFKFEQTGLGSDGKVIGQLKATGLRPMFSPRLEVVGYKLRGEIFGAGSGRY
jgi:pilus assembly protein CpaF